MLGHADGLSRLIPKYSEPLEDTVIAALKRKSGIKRINFCKKKTNPFTENKTAH